MLKINEILGFNGDNRFLSNFFPCNIVYQGILFDSTERAYVWAKTLIPEEKQNILKMETTGKVKRFGRSVTLRQDWEEVKIPIMRELLILKFTQEPFLTKLVETNDAYLEETNTWGDTFWGVCNGKGQNHLGLLLMEIREDLKVIQSLTVRDHVD